RRSSDLSCAYTQGKREQFSGFNRTLDAINNVFRKFSAFHDETGRLNVDGMNIISNDGSNKLNRSRKARVSYKVQRTINASLNAKVYAQNEMLAYQQKESTARVASIMENTNLSKQQQVSEIMRQMLTQAQTAGQYFTNDQIKEMTRKVSAEVDLVHQQTQNQRYGSSHIGATAKDISNVVTDAASGVVD